ncbi:MAG: hypothetical protein M1572_05895 [Gammaproteobacteria bacterium]|nr:hypothetical protein [Gammaproteobacteria bacterium]UCG19357.1 MAG: hypothetical protein JSU84_03900 [Thiotrichales bacterium]HQT02811.1 hypothetical protein [Thiotrichales bacterium]HQT04814.1 hypothetical protein [Thiotrichales bacterium]
MSAIEQSQLGHHTHYPIHYDPSLLFAVPRALNRAQLSPSPKTTTTVYACLVL